MPHHLREHYTTEVAGMAAEGITANININDSDLEGPRPGLKRRVIF